MNHNHFSILGINHLGLAAKDPEKSRWFFCSVLGLGLVGEELVQSQNVNTIMIETKHARPGPVGAASRLEILVPTPPGSGAVGKFLATRGGGIHHVALSVDKIESAIDHLQKHGVRMIDTAPRPGAHQTLIAFVHPESTGGFLVELVQEREQ